MKTIFFAAIVLLGIMLPASLCANPHILPDLEIGGISNTRAFLYKRNIAPTASDSLHYFIPTLYPNPIETVKAPIPASPKRLAIAIDADSYNNINTKISYYPPTHLSLVRSNIEFFAPYSYQKSAYADLFVGIPLSAENSLALSMKHRQNEYRKTMQDINGFSTLLYVPQMYIGSINSAENYIKLGVESSSIGGKRDSLYNDLSLSMNHNIPIGAYTLYNDILLSMTEPGFQTALELPSKSETYTRVKLGIMGNVRRILPSISFVHILAEDYGRRLSVSNSPSIQAYDASTLLKDHPQLFLPATRYLAAKPLDLNLQYIDLPQWDFTDIIKDYGISNRSMFIFDNPVPEKQADSLRFCHVYHDVFQNISAVNLGIRFGKNFELQNTASYTHSTVVSNSDYQLAYTPTWEIGSQLIYNNNKLDAALGFSQEYGSRDHNNKQLKESYRLYSALLYRIDTGKSIELQINNILNQKNKSLYRYDYKGISILLGYKVLL